MINTFCNTIIAEDAKCSYMSYKPRAFFTVKKGMAEKAFKKYVESGRVDMIQKQINKGTVLIHWQ